MKVKENFMGQVEIQEGLAGRQKGFHRQRPARIV